ncbi:MAG: DUF1573 domain-containing protein [candidate division Zixibacteria bacterium]|nr:DUF1573 domain-containing protein [candidate division Zixibacteria bacterium]
MKQSFLTYLSYVLLLAVIIVPATGAESPKGLVYSEQVYDFGHAGIGFKLFHTYYIANLGKRPVRITNLEVSCDCSTVNKSDSIINPGDTVFFTLQFYTKNLFGSTTKSFIVFLDDPKLPQLKFFCLSTIGQWYDDLKPDPISLFYLPGCKSKKVSIPNLSFDNISLSIKEQADTTFDIKVLAGEAEKNGTLVLDVIPKNDLKPSTYHSSFSLAIKTGSDGKPLILTIPTKIVRY